MNCLGFNFAHKAIYRTWPRNKENELFLNKSVSRNLNKIEKIQNTRILLREIAARISVEVRDGC